MSRKMPLFVDARIPVCFGGPDGAGPDCALLLQEGVVASPPDGVAAVRFAPPAPSHPAGCACCAPRGPAAAALGQLFLARARGEVPFFTVVVAVTRDAAGRSAVEDALARDPLVSARFRPG